MPRRIPFFRPPLPRYRDPAEVERKRFYDSAAWVRLRAAFLRANPLCVECEARGELVAATVADHVVERLARPDLALDWDNLRPLCNPCHTRRHKAKSWEGHGSPPT